MTEIKICGITKLEDALLSAELGADTLGFNFYSKSPRYITPENARVIVDQLPASVAAVGVFVDKPAASVAAVAGRATLDAIQLHGTESPEFVLELRSVLEIPVIKAFRVSDLFVPEDVLRYNVDAVLLDAYSPSVYGGSGDTFDWDIAKQVLRLFPKMYLAGGLSPENVRSAVNDVRPFAVDACSSLEISPGKKHPEKLRRFISEAKRND